MKVYIIPTWHPTPKRPLWCNWILPHIELLRESGVETYILQMGLDDEPIEEGADPWQQPAQLLNNYHLYIPVPKPRASYQRTRLFYGPFLRKYADRLKDMYRLAVDMWGKPDILHAHVSLPGGYAAAIVGNMFEIPVIVQEHYSGFESDTRYPWRLGWFVREMGRRIHGFYAVSKGFAKIVENTGLVKVTGVLPNPIDTNLFSPAQVKEESRCFRIVTAGNVSHRKGTDLLFCALHKLIPEIDWKLTLFGDTSQISKYGQWVNDKEFSQRLLLPGMVTQQELARVYSQSDLYVVSSRVETANVSMLQALACGVPIVTTSCGAPETLIDESVGIAVEKNDPHALAEGVRDVAICKKPYDPEKLYKFVVERYSKQVVAEKVFHAYELAINSF